MSQSKKVIVSGATGQDGSYMIEYLLENTENTVIAAVRRTSQAILSNLTAVLDNPRVKLVTLDLCDGVAVTNLIREEKPDYFINFGAQTFVKDSWDSPVAHMQTNAISLIYILEAIRKFVPQCRMYSCGSSEQWGDVLYSPQDEKHPMRPRSPYGVSKCTAGLLVKVYRESYGLYAVHGLLLNHESPRRQDYFVTRKITKGVARIAAAIKAGQPFGPIELGNLDAKRDWSHAKDFVDGIWRMLNQEMYRLDIPKPRTDIQEFGNKARIEETKFSYADTSWLQEYVLSSGETHTIREFVKKAFRVAGVSGEWIDTGTNEVYRMTYANISAADGSRVLAEPGVTLYAMPTIPLVRINPAFYRFAEVQLLHGDSSRARKELGWSPKHSFDDLVNEMVKSDLVAVGL